ncbi:MAG: cob(I)yrinic acid a,c-diamide adenosyltransferase [Planctomycetes bacterium]|nr:cob(I)yrinic acid a,c-diamide adenosyltransferase [Planctomycetota bacterium]NOG55124.1 cob(I)yrinic acid a,c-diamide adenosyltransferase [Planctomycetota bacterium]
MKLYTRSGDDGTTGLHGAGRVSKSDARVEAYGQVDELNSVIGWVRVVLTDRGDVLNERLRSIQNDLFQIGADLSTPADRSTTAAQAKVSGVGAAHVAQFEQWIDEAADQTPPITVFVLPAGTESATRLHMARCVCRRAERRLVTMLDTERIPVGDTVPERIILRYLNRLSDLLFAWARLANHEAGVDDVPWEQQ